MIVSGLWRHGLKTLSTASISTGPSGCVGLVGLAGEFAQMAETGVTGSRVVVGAVRCEKMIGFGLNSTSHGLTNSFGCPKFAVATWRTGGLPAAKESAHRFYRCGALTLVGWQIL